MTIEIRSSGVSSRVSSSDGGRSADKRLWHRYRRFLELSVKIDV
jgi:hypothetical protein